MQVIKEYVAEKKAALKTEIENKNIKAVVIQVGHVPASDRYVRNKIKDLESVSIETELIELPEFVTEAELLSKMEELNKDETVTGYLVQLPLPKHIDEEKIKLAVAPEKDIDGFHPMAKTIPATPLGVLTFLEDMNFEFTGKNAVVVGRSDIVGRPMAKLLLDKSMNVTVLHSKTSEKDKINYIANADLIVVATGHAGTLTHRYSYKPQAVIMDVGINFTEEGKMIGDCEKNLPVAFQSPVPGGCGLLTRLSVINNLLKLEKEEM